jgi:hypothetical protein
MSKVDLILRERTRQQSFGRYERRALSRRKSAARAFDTAFLEAVRMRGFLAEDSPRIGASHLGVG